MTFWKKKKRPEVVGLDIGTSAVKVVELKPKGSAYDLGGFGIAHIPAGAIQGGEVKQPDAVQQAIVHAQVAQADAQNAKAQATQAQAESQRLAAQLESLQASQTPRGIVLTLDDVLFDTGKAQLKSGARRSLDQIAAFLNENPERRVQVEGFTDSQGTNDFNLELSQSRADAVAMAIIQRGIDAQRVRALGYGEEFPVASNTNAGSRQLNRRVEIVVSNGDAAIPSRAPGPP